MMETEILSNLILNDEFLKSIWWQSPYEFKLGEHFLEQSGITSLEDLRDSYFFNPKPNCAIYTITNKTIHGNQFYNFGAPLIKANIEILTQKYTISLQSFERANEFYKILSRTMCERVTQHLIQQGKPKIVYPDVTAYVSLSKTFGFNKHCDKIDVFSFQQSGKVEWKVWDTTGKKLLLQSVQEPGDIIYVPKEFYHVVKRLSKNECHISLGIYADPVSNQDVM